jgi:hypothetical protein
MAEEAVALTERLADTDPDAYASKVAMTRNTLCTVMSNLGRHDEAPSVSLTAVAACRRLHATEPAAYEGLLADRRGRPPPRRWFGTRSAPTRIPPGCPVPSRCSRASSSCTPDFACCSARVVVGLRRSASTVDTQCPVVGGVALGASVTGIYAAAQGWVIVVPAEATVAALTATMVIGAVAGIYPAMRAARPSPTEALALNARSDPKPSWSSTGHHLGLAVPNW